MELHETLQELRKQKGLTQEELAQALYVSRTAISKWESGRGYPSIDSLKAIAKFFCVSIDELLCGDALLTLAEEENKQRETRLRDLVFGLLDLCVAMLLFLPLFAQRVGEQIQGVSLPALTAVSPYVRIAYFLFAIGIPVLGVLTLSLQNCRKNFWVQHKSRISLIVNAVAALLFIVSLQPYAAALLFMFLVIKVFLLIKKQG